MVHHEYTSPDYFAQTFVEFLRDTSYGPGFRSKQRGGMVSSVLSFVEWEISFEKGTSTSKYHLEMRVKGSDAEPTVIDGAMQINRSNQGRISGSHWRDFYRLVIFPSLKEFGRRRP